MIKGEGKRRRAETEGRMDTKWMRVNWETEGKGRNAEVEEDETRNVEGGEDAMTEDVRECNAVRQDTQCAIKRKGRRMDDGKDEVREEVK
jgi:hypothetical protein